MAETSNGGGAINEVASGVSGLAMSTPEGGMTMPLQASQFYQVQRPFATMTLIESRRSIMSLTTARTNVYLNPIFIT